MAMIDADTHVIESQAIWDLLDPSLRRRRPILVKIPEDTIYGDRNAFWLVDGRIHPNPLPGRGFRLHTPADTVFELSRTDTSRECREITSVAARLKDMDRTGVDVQVVYPTFFLQPVTDDVGLQVGLCRAWNAFMADVCRESDGRIRWVVVPPLLSPADVDAELEFGRANGAVGVFLHGTEEEGLVSSPKFFPLYEAALRNDLAICIHTGQGSRAIQDVGGNGLGNVVVAAFRGLIVGMVPEKFPGLRFGFLEAGSCWIPQVFHQLARQRIARSPVPGAFFAADAPAPAEIMENYNMYVACEADEDLAYILRTASGNRIVAGSDYGHIDPAFEAEMQKVLRSHDDVDDSEVDAITGRNGFALYGIDEKSYALD